MVLVYVGLAASRAPATELGIQGTQFTIDGKPHFLYGISYYGGLGAPQRFAQRDLDDMQRYGINWIRVWATWPNFGENLAALNVADGQPRQPYFDRLKWLIAECDRRGMVVDVTLARGDGDPARRLQAQEPHRRVVTTLVSLLKPYRNWYLDLANERNIRDQRFCSMADLKQLRDDVKRLDTGRLVTASHGSDISRAELQGHLHVAQVDFVCPHRPRDPGSPAQTDAVTRQLLAWMKELGRVVPVHYQEPLRRGYTDWQPRAGDFARDAAGATAGGAAGWCLHNGSEKHGPDEKPRRSFDLREHRLFDQLDQEELKALEDLRPIFLRR